MAQRLRGTILFYDPERRLGFIRHFDGDTRTFLGRREADRAGLFAKGDLVEFSVAPAPRGRTQAVDIALITKAGAAS